jgi:putative MATE family efflux protein
MKQTIDLLHGKIMRSLCVLALPIVMTYFIQMAYNLIDMIWIGRLGSSAVAGVGVAGMFTWFGNGLIMMAKMGGQVKMGHTLGAGDESEAKRYLGAMIQLGIVFGAVFGTIILLFAPVLVGFFHLSSTQAVYDAILYMRITCGLVIFTYMNQIFTASFNVRGDSRTPFFMNTTGLVINVVADPLLIFGMGPFPAFGVAGAAVATVFAQMVVFLLFLLNIYRRHSLYKGIRLGSIRPLRYYGRILRIGLPLSLQDMLFSCCSMLIARFVAVYGDGAVAAQKVGSQIESISWMAADGFMAAINAFISQNFGAGQYDRVKAGYRAIMKIVFVWGLFCTILLVVIPGPIFKIFLNDAQVLPIGMDYLRILGFSQLFMCAEITTAGAFGGLGNTLPPSIESILLTFMRIPLLLILTRTPLGLSGIWWSISISSILKGTVLVTWYLHYQRKVCH